MHHEQRSCQPCTACCEGHLELGEALQADGKSSACKHCASSGCGIYESRPVEPCQQFECLWLVTDSPLPDWMRPNDSRAIVTLNRKKKNDRPVLVALQMDSHLPKRTMRWLKEFSALYTLPLAVVKKSEVQVVGSSEDFFNIEFLQHQQYLSV